MLEIDLNLVKLADVLFRNKHTSFLHMVRMPTDSNNTALLLKDS